MGQLINLTLVTINRQPDAGSVYIVAGKATVTKSVTGGTEILYKTTQGKIDTLVVSESYSAVKALVEQYVPGVTMELPVLTINGRAAAGNVTFALDNVDYVFADANASHSVVEFGEPGTLGFKTYVVNLTPSAISALVDNYVGGHTIEDEGTPVTQRPVMNFVGAGVAVTDSGGKTTVTIPGGSATDPFAVHVNTGNEINGITAKGSPVGADILIIEDSAAAYAKKKILISSLPAPAASNMANTNLTLDANRNHALAGFTWTLNGAAGAGSINLGNNGNAITIGTNAAGTVKLGQDSAGVQVGNQLASGAVDVGLSISASNAFVRIGDSFTSASGGISIGNSFMVGAFSGTESLSIGESSAGFIEIGKLATGDVMIANASSGSIQVGASASGSITIGENSTGAILLGNAVSGTSSISVGTSMTGSGSINIGNGSSSSGAISIGDGATGGNITVGENYSGTGYVALGTSATNIFGVRVGEASSCPAGVRIGCNGSSNIHIGDALTANINIGNNLTGNIVIGGNQTGYVTLPDFASLLYADDTAASGGGVPTGGLYVKSGTGAITVCQL